MDINELDRFPGNNIHYTAIIGPNVAMGTGNYIGPYCIIGFPGEHKALWGTDKGVFIGNNNIITGAVTIDSGIQRTTTINSGCFIMKRAHIGHDAVLHNDVIVSCNAVIGGHVTVHEGANIGLNACIHQYQDIGMYSMLGMGTMVIKSSLIREFCTYAGAPARYLHQNEKGIDLYEGTQREEVAILMLSYERFEVMERVVKHNLANAGCNVDLFVWDNGSKDKRILNLLSQHAYEIAVSPDGENWGIAKPFNILMQRAYKLGYKYFQFMANDILEPEGWVKRKIDYIKEINNSGMVSICPNATVPYEQLNNSGMTYHPGDVIGQFMFTREVYEKVGSFYEGFGKYGPIDNDYNNRCTKAGFINYYLPALSSQHIDDNAVPDLYGYDKMTELQKSWQIYQARTANPDYYIAPNEDYVINMDQYFK